ncbi:MAG: iron ABC transporter permease [Peptococcaceae bacterium]|nr:iron ABC transporter permease [Peptococcaceae bacterium]
MSRLSSASSPPKLHRSDFLLIPAVLVLLALLALSVILAITFGPVKIPPADVARILAHQLFGFDLGAFEIAASRIDIIWNIRFPRVLMGAVVGSGLALAGLVMQAIVRNPLANPYILGISSGASLGAALSILLGAFAWFGNYGTAFGAFIGALATSLCVFSIAYSGRSPAGAIKLLLAGMAVNAICSAFTNFVIYTAKDAEGIRSVTFWMMGGLTASSWTLLGIPSVVVGAGVIFFLTQFRTLNTLLIGDEAALTLGINVTSIRKVYLICASAITGVVVAASGTIGFVGLIVPHVVRMLVGSDHRRVVPISIISGAIFLIWCDVFARMFLGNTELPIGIVTSMIGGPFFIWLMLTKTYGFGEE